MILERSRYVGQSAGPGLRPRRDGGGHAPGQLRALADPLRRTLLDLLLERAATVTEMAHAVGRPKSTIAYHVNLLVATGLIRVVRTRRVRAIEERYYGRIATRCTSACSAAPRTSRSWRPSTGSRTQPPSPLRPTPPTSCGAPSCTPASRSRRCGTSGRRSKSSPAGSPRSPARAIRSTASPPASTPPTLPPCPTPGATRPAHATQRPHRRRHVRKRAAATGGKAEAAQHGPAPCPPGRPGAR